MPWVKVSVAAWLGRVNDDTVRKWVKEGKLVADGPDGSIDWRAFAEYCSVVTGREVLPLAAYDMPAAHWQRSTARGDEPRTVPPTEGLLVERELRQVIRSLRQALLHADQESQELGRTVAALTDALAIARGDSGGIAGADLPARHLER